MCERWVGDWTNCNILTPCSFVFSSTSFSFCWAAPSGVLKVHSSLRGAGSLYSILSPTHWLQLTELPVAPGYIIVWHPPASCERRICTRFNLSTVKAISWSLRPDAPVSRLTAGSKVNMFHYNVSLTDLNNKIKLFIYHLKFNTNNLNFNGNFSPSISYQSIWPVHSDWEYFFTK